MKQIEKRLLILCGDDYHQQYLISYLSKKFCVVAVFIESQNAQANGLLKSKKYIDYLYVKYHRLRRILLGLDSYRKKYFKCTQTYCNNIFYVKNINAPDTVSLVSNYEFDFVIICCTSIIRSALLKLIFSKAINIHGGMLPYYRGNHCFFFTLLNRDYSKVASTLHFIECGIDTGPVIETIHPPMFHDDIPETLYCRAEKLAIHRLADILSRYDNADAIPRVKQCERHHLYKTRDRGILKEIKYYYLKALGKISIPSVDNSSVKPLNDSPIKSLFLDDNITADKP